MPMHYLNTRGMSHKVVFVDVEDGIILSNVVPCVRVLELNHPAFPLARQIHTMRQVRDVMCQGVILIHFHGSVSIASYRGIGQQVTQITTQQGRPQNRILVTGCQVVNADQDDRVQDDDLAQKDDLFFRIHGTEEMPKSDVFVTLSVSTAFCCVLYNGDGGSLCCRLVCHRSNEATTGVRLVFTVDEGRTIQG